MFSPPPKKDKEPSDIQLKLKAAIQFARTTCILGSSNLASDIEKTNGWVLNQKSRYDDGSGHYVKSSQDSEVPARGNYVFDPQKGKIDTDKKKKWHYKAAHKQNSPAISLHLRFKGTDPLQSLSHTHQEVLKTSLKASTTRQGNCLELSCLIAKFLWEHPLDIKKIEIIQFTTFDHVLVIVNRTGDISDSTSWGKDCFVVDGQCSSEQKAEPSAMKKKFLGFFSGSNKNQPANEQQSSESELNNAGIIFSGADFDTGIKKIKDFFNHNIKRLEAMDVPVRAPIKSENEVLKAGNIYTTIIPETHTYPASFESFYDVYSAYPESEQKVEYGEEFFSKEKHEQQEKLLAGFSQSL
ncbi:MAG: hypothetical protein ABI597_11305 [Gammaproteobacteria bacterium]